LRRSEIENGDKSIAFNRKPVGTRWPHLAAMPSTAHISVFCGENVFRGLLNKEGGVVGSREFCRCDDGLRTGPLAGRSGCRSRRLVAQARKQENVVFAARASFGRSVEGSCDGGFGSRVRSERSIELRSLGAIN